MRYFDLDTYYVKGECESCGRVLKVRRENTTMTENGFSFTTPVICPCGMRHTLINSQGCAVIESPYIATAKHKESAVCCPKCKSTQISAGNKGFGLGKAVAGALIVGPIGALGGFLGSSKTVLTCMKCGNRWEPRK